MSLLSIKFGEISFHEKPLFKGLNFNLLKNQRWGLIGQNGAGKSTLLKILSGFLLLDHGIFFACPHIKRVYLPQNPILPREGNVFDFLSKQVPPEEEYKIYQALEMWEIPPHLLLETLSGGEKRRITLAQAIIQDPEVLLLDEPTNHLDLPTITVLEKWLEKFQGGLVVISHDRQFLRKTTNQMALLDRGQFHTYPKGYEFYEDWMEIRQAEEESHRSKLEKKLEAETHWLHRGVTARRKRNQGRLGRLKELRQERREFLTAPGKVTLPPLSQESGSRLIFELENVGKAWVTEENPSPRWMIRHFSTRILRGDRIGIMGPNGCGKTTFLKLLTGDLAPDEGKIQRKIENFVYFDQHRQALDPEKTLWQTLCPEGGDHVYVQGNPRHVVGYLKEFLFPENQVHALVKTLSGGQANRLLLAKILATPSSLLILDEPTNDLDMDTLELLEETLADYTGTLIVVSHDRDFLDRVVTSTILLGPEGQAQEYAGGFTDAMAQGGDDPKFWTKNAPSPIKPFPKEEKKEPTSRPPRLSYQQQRRLQMIPVEIEKLTQEIESLEKSLSNPDLYGSHPQVFLEKSDFLTKKKEEREALEEEWLELSFKDERP